MTPGKTFDTFYQNLKQLKRLYPDAYGFSVPHGFVWLLNQFSCLFETGIGRGYQTDFTGVYYDFWGSPPKYVRGGVDEKYKKMLKQ